MKNYRIFLILSILLPMFMLQGCGGSSDSGDSSYATEEDAEQSYEDELRETIAPYVGKWRYNIANMDPAKGPLGYAGSSRLNINSNGTCHVVVSIVLESTMRDEIVFDRTGDIITDGTNLYVTFESGNPAHFVMRNGRLYGHDGSMFERY